MTRITKALAMVAVLGLAGCPQLLGLVEKPRVSVKRVDLAGFDLAGLSANFVLGVDNPNPFGLPVGKLDYQLTVDGHTSAEGHADQNLSIPANGSGEVVLPVRVQFVELGLTVESMLSKQELPYTIRVRIGFDTPAGLIEIPLEKSGTFPVPRLPDVSLGDVRMGDVGLTGMTLNVQVGLHNPNAFALPVGALDYRITVNGTQVASGSCRPRTLAPNATETETLAVKIDPLMGGLSIAQALQAGRARVGLDGTLGVGAMQVPVHLSTQLG